MLWGGVAASTQHTSGTSDRRDTLSDTVLGAKLKAVRSCPIQPCC